MPSISSVASTNTISPAAGVLVPALDTTGTDDPAVVDLGDLATTSDLTALDDRVTTLESTGSSGGSPADTAPASPSAYDDEFTGTSLDAKWTQTKSGSGTFTVEYSPAAAPSCVLAHLTTTNDSIALTQPISPGTGAFSLTAKFHGALASVANSQCILFAQDATEANSVFAQWVYDGATYKFTLDRVSSGSFSNVASSVVNSAGPTYLHVQRDASNNWSTWYSADGIAWKRSSTTVSLTFTVHHVRITMGFSGGVGFPSKIACDWFRYNWMTL